MLRCSYCNSNNEDKIICEDYDKDNSIEVRINTNEKTINACAEWNLRDSYYYGSIEASVKIAYCPFCGRKL